jgi:hypothetical protein
LLISSSASHPACALDTDPEGTDLNRTLPGLYCGFVESPACHGPSPFLAATRARKMPASAIGTKQIGTECSSREGVIEIHCFKCSRRGQQVIVSSDRRRDQQDQFDSRLATEDVERAQPGAGGAHEFGIGRERGARVVRQRVHGGGVCGRSFIQHKISHRGPAGIKRAPVRQNQVAGAGGA